MVRDAFEELYVEYAREGRIDPASDPRAAFDRAHAAMQASRCPAGSQSEGREALPPPGGEGINAAVIRHVSLPLLDAMADGSRGAPADGAPDDRPHEEEDEEGGGAEEEASLLPEPPTLGGWFVNRRQTLEDEAPDPNEPAAASGAPALQVAPGDAAWPQWLR